MILTPGGKKRFLEKLEELEILVWRDQDREVIMFWTAQLMPLIVSELNYYEPPKKTTKKRKKVRSTDWDAQKLIPDDDY